MGKRKAKPAEKQPVNTGNRGKMNPVLEAHKWKPGESGNPAGRPRRATITDAMYAELMRPCELKGSDGKLAFPGKTNLEVLALRVVEQALVGGKNGFPYVEEVLKRIDGIVKQRVEVDVTERSQHAFIVGLVGNPAAATLADRLALELAASFSSVASPAGGADRDARPVEALPAPPGRRV